MSAMFELDQPFLMGKTPEVFNLENNNAKCNCKNNNNTFNYVGFIIMIILAIYTILFGIFVVTFSTNIKILANNIKPAFESFANTLAKDLSSDIPLWLSYLNHNVTFTIKLI